MRSLITTPAFTFDGREFTHADVAIASVLWGDWQALTTALEEGLACEAAAGDAGEAVDDGELKAAVVAYRRQRGLTAGEDLRRWLDERRLDYSELTSHLRRELLRSKAGARAQELVAGQRVAASEAESRMRAEALCSGLLRTSAERLVRCAAAGRSLGQHDQPPDLGPEVEAGIGDLLEAIAQCPGTGLDELDADDLSTRARTVLELDASYRHLADLVASEDRTARCVAGHQLDWQRFGWEEASFVSEPAAREALMCVREDGMTLDEVAQLAGASAVSHAAYLDETDRELAGVLLATQPDDVTDPQPANGGWRVVQVRERIPADVGDATLRARARDELLEDALERHMVGRVSWHGDF